MYALYRSLGYQLRDLLLLAHENLNYNYAHKRVLCCEYACIRTVAVASFIEEGAMIIIKRDNFFWYFLSVCNGGA